MYMPDFKGNSKHLAELESRAVVGSQTEYLEDISRIEDENYADEDMPHLVSKNNAPMFSHEGTESTVAEQADNFEQVHPGSKEKKDEKVVFSDGGSSDLSGILNFFSIEKKKAQVEVKKHFLIEQPDYMRGIYLTNNTVLNEKKLNVLITEAKKYDINTFVVDVQGRTIPRATVRKLILNQIYPVARVVVFQGGLNAKTAPKSHIRQVLSDMQKAAKAGFQEMQLDYIRYADKKWLQKLPLRQKYKEINGILARARKQADKLNVRLSADVFGRITLNQHDHIGQRLENFGKYVHNIYPMLYPSHYTNDPARIADPYGTVKEGVANTVERLPDVKVIAYIQGFKMKISSSGLSLADYIRAQIRAVESAKGHGWVIWNPHNRYESSYSAIEKHRRHTKAIAEKEHDIDNQG